MFRNKKTKQTARQPIYSPPAEVFSYHARRSPSPDSRRSTAGVSPAHRRSTSQWVRILPSIISIAAIVGSIFYATSLSTKPRIQVNGGGGASLLRDSGFYENEASLLLKKSIFNHSKLTINTTKVAHELEAQYPELGEVTIIIPLSGHRPVFEVKPAQPIMKLSGDGGIFIIDEEGRALISANDAGKSTDVLPLPFVVDESGLQLEKGKQVLPLSTVNFIRILITQLHAKNFQIDSVILPKIPNELHLRVSGYPFYIKFDLQGSAREQAGTFMAALEKLQSGGATPSEYIDVRVPEKAFYR